MFTFISLKVKVYMIICGLHHSFKNQIVYKSKLSTCQPIYKKILKQDYHQYVPSRLQNAGHCILKNMHLELNTRRVRAYITVIVLTYKIVT